MFSNPLSISTFPYKVDYLLYALSHYRKAFEKKYKGNQWIKTELSFFEDLKRLRMPNNKTQYSMQIDELKHKGDFWLFKYDFRIAGTKESSKTSGNRIVGVIDNKRSRLNILIIYGKTDLPKNQSETSFIMNTIENIYPEVSKLFK